jgi:Holliday junction resolvase RusA-like endonuclease
MSRTFTVRYNQRPWTSNSARAAKHWSVNARRTAEWRQAFAVLARAEGIPPLGPSRITVTPYLKDRRSRQDVGACFPAYKAAQDGLVDAGVWKDDDATNVVEVTFRPAVFGQGEGLELVIEPTNRPTFLTR